MITVPRPEELSRYYQTYLKYVGDGEDLLQKLQQQREETSKFLETIPDSRASFRYAPDKWMLKEVVGHVSDTERILSYRALRIARGDRTPMNGFDENAYTPASNYDARQLSNIAAELRMVREATLSLVENLSPAMIDQKGTANGETISVRGIIFMIYVHQQHHMQVIRERYLA